MKTRKAKITMGVFALCITIGPFVIVGTNIPYLLMRMAKMLAASYMPIKFYGRVIDENNEPVADANTSYIVANMGLNGSPTLSGPRTDARGYFAITGIHGPQISVWVKHPNYYDTDSSRTQITYSEPIPSDSPPIPTANDPIIFVLHTKGISEQLVHKSMEMHLPMDGTPVSVDLKAGKTGSSNMSIALALQSDGDKLPLNQYYPFDWSLNIQVTGGGILERLNKFQFRSPAEGYQPAFSYSQSGLSPRGVWKEKLEKEFFLLLPSGNYARIKVHMMAMKGFCRLESFLNPNPGSTNLEYDSAKQMTP